MRKKLSELIDIELETINKLFDMGFIDPTTVNAFLIYQESIEMKQKHPELSNYRIHDELAAKHNVSPASVYKWCKMFSTL